MRARHIIIIAVLLLAFGLRVHLSTELGTQADEGVFATAAKQLIEGDTLYRDLFWNHTPGLPLLLAFAFRLAGAQVLTGRLLSLSAAMITVASLILAGRWLSHDMGSAGRSRKVTYGAGILAGLLFALAPLPIFWSRFAMLENFETAFAVLSITLAIRAVQMNAPRAWFFAGVMAGLALLFKISALVLIGTVALFLVIWWLARPGGEKIRAGLLFMGGMVVSLLPIALMILLQGSGPDFVHLISGAERLAPLIEWQDKIVSLLDWVIRRPFIPLALLGLLLAARLRQPALLLISLWATLEVFFLFLPPTLDTGWGGFSHYMLPAVAALCLLAGTGLAWGWQQLSTKQYFVFGAFGIACLLAVMTLPGLIRDYNYAANETEYPSSGFAQEDAVGQVLSLVTSADSPVLVFGNSVFYLLSDRPPANRFYHYPQYLPTSRLAAESDEALVSALQNPNTAAVLLTGAKKGTLTEAIQLSLAEHWMPVVNLPYNYQRGATLFLPRSETTEPSSELARFDANMAEIILHNLVPRPLSPTMFLIELEWSATRPVDEAYTVFVHLVGPDGALATQHDSMPVINTRPTTSWEAGDLVSDWHLLILPPNTPAGDYTILVGLYQLETGERLSLLGSEETTAAVPLQVPEAD